MKLFTEMNNSRFQEISGTKYICIARDNAMTPACLKLGSIVWDWYLLQSVWNALEIQNRFDKVPKPFVLDVGAYIGDTVQMFLNLDCEVWAFEIYEDAFYCLQHNCPESSNFQIAIGDGRRVNFVEPEANTGNGHCVPDDFGVLETKKIDDLGLTSCDLIKIDVEGYEVQVLDGAQQVLQELRPLVILEINLDALDSYGFCEEDVYERLKRVSYDHRVLTFPERVGTTLPWDILCVPK